MFTYKEGCTFKTLDDIAGKKITVMGLGLNGGGEACVRFFLKRGAFVTVTDMKTPEQLKPTIERLNSDESLDKTRLNYILGEHRIQDFESADCVIKNPGVKIEGNKFLAAAKNIETDISLFLHFSKAPIIAVTGSKGKSSTASAIHYGLCKAGYTSFLGGNITVSPLTFLEKTSEETPVVLELSSWQLADLRGRNALKPYIAIITKIVPDHQNWYGNMEDYVADKRLIYASQTKGDYTIVDADADEKDFKPKDASSWGKLFASETKGTVLYYKRTAPSEWQKFYGVWQQKTESEQCGFVFLPGMKNPEKIMESLSVPGEHMRTNALNAALVLYLMGVNPKKIINIMKSWQGLDHRLQYFYEYKGIKFYNDSCATVPEAAGAASQAFEKPVYLLCGGTDKGLDFSAFINLLAGKAKKEFFEPKSIYLLEGSGTDKIVQGLKENNISYSGPFPSLEDMLNSLKVELDKNGTKGDVVVFSPGATSFGMFSNEFDRGNKYMQAVKKIMQQD